MATAEQRRSALERELGIEGIDPTTFSVLIRRYVAVVDEMTAALENAAWTSILALARDFSCAIFDGETRLIAMHEGAPLHVSGMHVVLEEIAHRFEGKIGDGDVMICNDPYSGNSHVGDVVIAAPVFAGGELCFWSAVKVHHLDIGAPWPTSMPYLATDVWTEGLTLPPLKIYDHGQYRDDVFAMILANLRYPDQLLGDLLAQQGSVGVGKRALLEIVDRLGLESVKKYTDAIRRYAYKRAGDEISTWRRRHVRRRVVARLRRPRHRGHLREGHREDRGRAGVRRSHGQRSASSRRRQLVLREHDRCVRAAGSRVPRSRHPSAQPRVPGSRHDQPGAEGHGHELPLARLDRGRHGSLGRRHPGGRLEGACARDPREGDRRSREVARGCVRVGRRPA